MKMIKQYLHTIAEKLKEIYHEEKGANGGVFEIIMTIITLIIMSILSRIVISIFTGA